MLGERRQARIRIVAEAVIIGLVSVAAFSLAAHYDLFEQVVAWSRQFEVWQIDELVILVGVLVVAMAAFALRRWGDLRREIARRVASEAVKEEVEARYRVLVETSPDAITLTDLEGVILMTNERAARLHGFDSPEAMIGLSAWDLISRQDRAKGVVDTSILLEEGAIRNVEYTILKADGRTTYPAEMSVSLLRDGEGHPRYLLAVIRDISRRQEVEQALQHNVSRLEILHQVDRAMIATRSCEKIVIAALDALRDLLDPDLRANVILSSQDSGEGTVFASSVPDEPYLPLGTPIPLDEIFSLGTVSKSGVVLLHESAFELSTLPLMEHLGEQGIRSVMMVPMVLQGVTLGTLNLGATSPHAFRPEYERIAIEVAEALALAIHQARLSEEVAFGRERLSKLSQRLMETQERQRQRIARELHDQIGQSLVAVKLQLQSMSGLGDRDHLGVRLRESIAVVERTICQVRELSFDLRPSVLDDLGLVATLRWYVDRQSAWARVPVQFVPDPPEMDLPPEIEVAAFRIAQEALTNALHHARAQEVCVCLDKRGDELVLCVQDDGLGFNAEAVLRGEPEGQSLGLLGMQERAQLVGGRLEIESVPGQGTMVRAQLPLPEGGHGDGARRWPEGTGR